MKLVRLLAQVLIGFLLFILLVQIWIHVEIPWFEIHPDTISPGWKTKTVELGLFLLAQSLSWMFFSKVMKSSNMD